MPENPPVLSYDPLPPGSQIRCERRPDGIRLTIPAGEVPAEFLRAAGRRVVVPAANYSGIAIFCAMALARLILGPPHIERALFPWALAAMVIVCAATFALIHQLVFRARADFLRRAHRQATLIDADPRRILIESIGPVETASREIPADGITSISVVREEALRLGLTDQSVITLFVWRDPRELHWLAQSLRAAAAIAADER